MTDSPDPFIEFATVTDESNEAVYIRGRLTNHTYLSAGFPYNRPNSSETGQPARFVYHAFENSYESGLVREGEHWVVTETPGGRVQLKIALVRDEGRVKELWIFRIPTRDDGGAARVVLNLKEEEAQRLVNMLKVIDLFPLEGERVRIPDDLIRRLLYEPLLLEQAYSQESGKFRELIQDDESATDVVAVRHRRTQVELFHKYLDDDEYFDRTVADNPGGAEAVWQRFFESNPWILGMGLGSQLLTSWDEDKLEQVTAGRSIFGVGKRTDALMTTSGRIKSMVFAEVKTHRTPLLERDHYRVGCWAPAEHLAGGVSQVQGTVHRTSLGFIDRLQKENTDGTDKLGDFAYLLRPKSYLIIGQLGEFIGAGGGHHADKVRSFELYRRHLQEPEVITFDELLARADWIVDGY